MSGPIRVEPDVVRGKALAVAIVVSVGVTVAGVLAGWIALRVDERAAGAGPLPVVEAPRQIHHGLIEEERPGARERARARAALERWSWVDRSHRIVAMPIRRAIELLGRQGAAGGGGR
jgi:hypothetical protein